MNDEKKEIQERKKTTKKKRWLFTVVIICLLISLGYAYQTDNLKIIKESLLSLPSFIFGERSSVEAVELDESNKNETIKDLSFESGRNGVIKFNTRNSGSYLSAYNIDLLDRVSFTRLICIHDLSSPPETSPGHRLFRCYLLISS